MKRYIASLSLGLVLLGLPPSAKAASMLQNRQKIQAPSKKACEISGYDHFGDWTVLAKVVGGSVIGPLFNGGQGTIATIKGNTINGDDYFGNWTKLAYTKGNDIIGPGYSGGMIVVGDLKMNKVEGPGYSGGWVELGSFSSACTPIQAAAGAYMVLLKKTQEGVFY